MGHDTGPQAFPPEEDHREQKADGGGVADLQQGGQKIRAVEQIHNVADAKGDAGDENCQLQIVPGDGPEQQPPENHLFQKAHTEHTQNKQQGLRKGSGESGAVPQIHAEDQQKGQKVQKILCISPEGAQPIFRFQSVPVEKAIQEQGEEKGDGSGNKLLNAQSLRKTVGYAE